MWLLLLLLLSAILQPWHQFDRLIWIWNAPRLMFTLKASAKPAVTMPAPPPLMSASYRTAAHACVGLWEGVVSGACTSWHPLNVNNFCSYGKLASRYAQYNCHREVCAVIGQEMAPARPCCWPPLRCSHGCDHVTQTCPGRTVVALICCWMSQQQQAVTNTSNTYAFVLEHTHLWPRACLQNTGLDSLLDF